MRNEAMRRDKIIRNLVIKLIVRQGWDRRVVANQNGATVMYLRARHQDVGEFINLSKRRIG